MRMENSMMMIMNEIKLLNLIGSVIKGLLLCHSLGLPHGNLSGSTIYKGDKFSWQISPPTYSRNNLNIRIQRMKELEEKMAKEEDPIQYKKIQDEFQKNHLRFLLPKMSMKEVFASLKSNKN